MYIVMTNGKLQKFDGIDAFRNSCRTATQAARDTPTGLAKNDVKWIVEFTGELITHTKIGDRVKGEI